MQFRNVSTTKTTMSWVMHSVPTSYSCKVCSAILIFLYVFDRLLVCYLIVTFLVFREWLFGPIDKNRALTCTAQVDHILGNDQHDFSVNKNARSMKDALALILGITRRRIEECRERSSLVFWKYISYMIIIFMKLFYS